MIFLTMSVTSSSPEVSFFVWLMKTLRGWSMLQSGDMCWTIAWLISRSRKRWSIQVVVSSSSSIEVEWLGMARWAAETCMP